MVGQSCLCPVDTTNCDKKPERCKLKFLSQGKINAMIFQLFSSINILLIVSQ